MTLPDVKETGKKAALEVAEKESRGGLPGGDSGQVELGGTRVVRVNVAKTITAFFF